MSHRKNRQGDYGCDNKNSSPQGSTNNPPEIQYVVANPDTLEMGALALISCSASDIDGDELSYVWSCQYGSFPEGVTTNSVQWIAPHETGDYMITVTVSDGEITINRTLTIHVLEISGCTDPTAVNYFPEATIDNGSCVYSINRFVPLSDSG